MEIINTNVVSLNTQRNLSKSNSALATSMERLSSGLRINSAKDDAAGLAISERFSTQIRGMNVAIRNANDGISLSQTAESALSSVGDNLQRIRELAVQSSNATNSQTDRDALQSEVTQLLSEIDRVANQTSFNGKKLLDGSFTGQLFQVGANSGETISISAITDANTAALGSVSKASGAALSVTATSLTSYGTAIAAGGVTINGVDIGAVSAASSTAERAGQLVNAINNVSAQSGVGASYDTSTGQITLTSAAAITVAGTTNDATVGGYANGSIGTVTTTTGISTLNISSYTGSQLAIDQIDSALSTINSTRANLGAIQNRFTSTVSNLQNAAENLSASRSRVRDTDFAAETAELSRTQVLKQAGTAMLAQANQAPQSVLGLLR